MTKVLPLKIYPDPVLRIKGKKLTVAEIQSDEIQQLILDMEETMITEEGIGLAAPQIGKSLRLTVIRTDDGSVVLINPRILMKSLKKEKEEEGCLSIPEVFGTVRRAIKIRVSAFDQNGKKIKFTANGLFARVILHEVDHLNGILFIDRSKEITKGQEVLAKMKKSNDKS
ncbi:MAG: peptide deformylase [Parcubacteria group bacterium]|jgi:peptide deformylase|nr:peptide deformylase [Parcubacteria group bacterium]|tara:strand:- start:682 stop:1191 length:510 start_codon:yes stop_codon:yes gene_type:complete